VSENVFWVPPEPRFDALLTAAFEASRAVLLDTQADRPLLPLHPVHASDLPDVLAQVVPSANHCCWRSERALSDKSGKLPSRLPTAATALRYL
jgi:hypothetical protein